MQADSVSRRDLFKNAAAIGLAAMPFAANALVEYENVPFLGGSDIIDINNANVRVYTRLPGMYPSIAKQIVKNVPFKSVEDLYTLKTLSTEQKEIIKKYEKNLVALEPAPEVWNHDMRPSSFDCLLTIFLQYVLDNINNGLYR
jgi:photosystem II PsbU protein